MARRTTKPRPKKSAAGRRGTTANATGRPRHWLMKSEPEVFSFADLEQAPRRTTGWDGVRNYQARNFLRDDVALGDLVLFYHSNGDPPGVVGIAEIAREAYPDPTQFEPESPACDPASPREAPRWLAVDVRAVRSLPQAVPIGALKANPRLAAMAVVQRGQRLSVQPVSAAEFAEVLRMGGLDPDRWRFGS